MNSFRRTAAFQFGGASLVAAYLLATGVFMGALAPSPAAAAGDISVKGTAILRDGRPWVAKGVDIVGRTAPDAFTHGGDYKHARAIFGADELEAAKRYGADLIRFQVSQAGSDPQSTLYSEDYLSEVQTAVKLARDQGFSVIVCLDAEKPSGVDEMGMPNEKAIRAWKSLAPLFATDRGVMLELFNEPSVDGPDAVKPHDWSTWKSGMQPLVDEVRALGAKNVLLLDGLYWAQMIEGAPALKDSLSQDVFAVHPYYSPRLPNESAWNDMFGNYAKTHAVLVTEWNARSGRKNCNSEYPQFAAGMLNYLNRKKIGIVIWAFDFPDGVFETDFKGALTSYDDFQCGPDATGGAGEITSRYFKGLAIPIP
jgi:hypothetical protein